jgi:hypothetical protein
MKKPGTFVPGRYRSLALRIGRERGLFFFNLYAGSLLLISHVLRYRDATMTSQNFLGLTPPT